MSRKIAEEPPPRLRERHIGRGRVGRSQLIDELREPRGLSPELAGKLPDAKTGRVGDPGAGEGRSRTPLSRIGAWRSGAARCGQTAPTPGP